MKRWGGSLFWGGWAGAVILSAVPLFGDWPQWRGALQTGYAPGEPPLIMSLPESGILPVWVSEEIPSARDGGWGSPVVVQGHVYLFAHARQKLKDPGPRKYPWLPPSKRTGMSAEEYAEYERLRRDEDERRAKAYAFREHIYCFDAETGKTIWHHKSDSVYTRFPQSGSPTIADGKLFILGAGRVARCFDAETGDPLWQQPLSGSFRDEFYQSSILMVDGVAVLVAGSLFGLDAETGEILWESPPEKTRGTHSSPVVWNSKAGPKVIVNLAGGMTACLDPRTGEEHWRAKTDGGLATPVVVGHRLITYGNSRKKGVRCFTLALSGAEPVWKFHGVQDKGSSPVVVGEYLYVQGERRVACIHLETGDPAWTGMLDLASPQYTSLIATDDLVFYAYDGLTAFRSTPENFDPVIQAKFNAAGLMASEATFRKILKLEEIEKSPDGQEKAIRLLQREIGRNGPLKCSTPAISGGRLYIRTPSNIMCYDLRTR